jgi:ferredoxin-NADP reductase
MDIEERYPDQVLDRIASKVISTRGVGLAMTIIPVTIIQIMQATPTIRILTLDLDGQDFTYRAGQWIDCYAVINGERKVVGYSLASSPANMGTIEVAVKESDNPVTEYVHDSAQIGDTLFIEGGQGEVFYTDGFGDQVVLIGAGIGVAPLMGMLRYIDDSTNASVTMIQSASTVEEMVYFHEASGIAGNNQRVRYHATVTQAYPKESFGRGRISRETLVELGVDFESIFYLSGPGGMIPEMEDILRSMGVPDDRIRYEVWWKPTHETV